MKLSLMCAALLLVTAFGCDEDEAKPVAAEDFCAAYTLAMCEGFEDCCIMRDDGIAVGGEGTFESCLRSNQDYCQVALIAPEDVGRPDTSGGLRVVLEYNAQGAGEALASIRSAAASCVEPPFITARDTHLLGAKGEPCLLNAHCGDAFVCAGASPADPGICADAPVEGQVCEARCAGSLICLEEICVKVRQEGQSCAFDDDCGRGLFCFYDTGTGFPNSDDADGLCVQLRADGESCELDYECSTGNCASNIVCRAVDDGEDLPWCFVDGPIATF
jgi:hypothetical protein